MLLIRRFEELVQSLFLRGEVYGTTHLCSGQEAVSVGFASALAEGDRVACTYRGHGHLLARGLAPEALLAELLGPHDRRQRRPCRLDEHDRPRPRRDRLLRDRRREHRRRDRRGARAEGHWANRDRVLRRRRDEPGLLLRVPELRQGARRCPSLFVCENNGYGEYTAIDAVTAGRIVARAEAMEVPAIVVDGMDVWAVRDAALEAVEPGPERRAAPCSSRRARTGSSATRAATPASTGRRASSRSGRSATRSSSPSARLTEEHGVAADQLREVVERRRARARRGRAVGARRAVPRAVRRSRSSRSEQAGPCRRAGPAESLESPAEAAVEEIPAAVRGAEQPRRAAARGARPPRPEPARAGAPARGLAEPRLPDRDRARRSRRSARCTRSSASWASRSTRCSRPSDEDPTGTRSRRRRGSAARAAAGPADRLRRGPRARPARRRAAT